MKITQIGKPEIIMQNPDGKHNYFAWPTVTRLQNGKIAVVASGFRIGHLCPFGKTVISYSEDEGKSYSAPSPLIDTPLDDRDGGIMAFGENGVVVTSFNNTTAFQKRHMNNWTKDEKMRAYYSAYIDTVTPEAEEKYLGSLYRVSHDCGVTFGPIQKSPVTSPHGPCELPDGTILYVGSPFEYDSKNPPENIIAAYAVTEDGKSEYRGEIEPIYVDGVRAGVYEPYAFALSDGTVICHIRTEDDKWPSQLFTVYQSVSKDGGRTWSKPEAIADKLYGAPPHIMRHSSGTLVATVGCRVDPTGIKALFSTDNGKTWQTGYDVCVLDASWDIGYPSTVELSDGSLITVFYAHAEKDGPAVIMQQKWRFDE